MPQGDAVQEVKDRLDIVEVINGYVRLQRAGREFKGLCPFHSEKSPSFTVSEEKQVFFCFGCQAGGDMFEFIQKAEGLDFPQTLEMLAGRAGVELEDRGGGRRRGQERTRAREVNLLAAQYFHHVLLNHPSGGRGLRYLEKRGVEKETIEAFMVGYAPAGGRSWDNLLRFLRKKGISDEEAVKAGLALGGEGRRTIDRFRGRLMIPIRDETGTLIAFGGRAMDNTPPKYMNSPQTSIYDKGRTIFGLSEARKKVQEQDRALLVEGYFDVMMAHQNGIDIAVASSGTAFTDEQVKILRRSASELLVCLDTDEAGRQATRRVIEMASRAHMRVLVVELPNAKDPGEFFQRTPHLWGDAEGAALPGWEWWIGLELAEHNLSTADGRAAAAAALVGVLSRIPEETTLDVYCQFVAAKLSVDAANVLADVQRFRKSGGRARDFETVASIPVRAPAAPVPGAGAAVPRHAPEEDRLLAFLISRPPLAGRLLQELTAEEALGAEEFTELCARVVEVSAEGEGNLERHLELFSEEERQRIVRLSMTANAPGDEAELRAALADCVDRIRLKSYEAAMAELEKKIAGTGTGDDQGSRDGLLLEIHELAQRRSRLKMQLFQGRA
ncbi:MAG: primase [Chloroflexota bacterium]|nr:primase [Chloroflexota bacterium]